MACTFNQYWTVIPEKCVGSTIYWYNEKEDTIIITGETRKAG